MNTERYIVVTGAAGFIGSCLVSALNQKGYNKLILVDDFNRPEKEANLLGKRCFKKIDRNDFAHWLQAPSVEIGMVFHLGARTDTTEFDRAVFDKLNLNYSKMIWEACSKYQIPLIYASSAATYGMGEFGYADSHNLIPQLKPLNPYGESKQAFDVWALQQQSQPPRWAGLKFFNVYGPNEYHKGRMASVIFHAYKQIKQSGKVRLFRSHVSDFADGMQLRDFVYVNDLIDVCCFIMEQSIESGIYNLGSGNARTFIDLAQATFAAMGAEVNIEFIDIPEDIRDKYQYYTEAQMEKLRRQGYQKPFTSLEAGVYEYVSQYLKTGNYF